MAIQFTVYRSAANVAERISAFIAAWLLLLSAGVAISTYSEAHLVQQHDRSPSHSSSFVYPAEVLRSQSSLCKL